MGINEDYKIQNSKFQISPNPSNGKFALIMNNEQGITNNEVTVFNAIGQVVHQQISKSANQQIDLSNNPDGVYYCTMKNEKWTTTKKLVLMK